MRLSLALLVSLVAVLTVSPAWADEPDPCRLIEVPVLDCDSRVQRYVAAAGRVPAAHWRLVLAVGITAERNGKALDDFSILLPARPAPWTLWHEVGHIVSWQADGALIKRWMLDLWPLGKSTTEMVSDYANRTPSEDFAESYAAYLDGKLAACCTERVIWLAEHVFALADHPVVPTNRTPNTEPVVPPIRFNAAPHS